MGLKPGTFQGLGADLSKGNYYVAKSVKPINDLPQQICKNIIQQLSDNDDDRQNDTYEYGRAGLKLYLCLLCKVWPKW